MTQAKEIEQVRLFVQRYADKALFSTGVKIVDFADDLYNVKGSTEDPMAVPDYRNVNWKNLLVRHAGLADASCYVTNAEAADGSSHPKFLVGGHMTPNSSGEVEEGKATYLMPLCKWHNSTGRNGVAFEHTETKMLKLSGFMQGDLAITFAARLPSDEPRTLIYFNPSHDGWEFKNMMEEKAPDQDIKLLSVMADVVEPVHEYVLFERTEDGLYFVKDTNL